MAVPASGGDLMVGEVLEQVRERIAREIEHGASLEEVDELVIGPARGLDEDERAALWLYAWSSPVRREWIRDHRTGRHD
jgi:hypothetical protein